MQLYELPAAHAALMERIEDNEGEIDPLTETALCTLSRTVEDAAEGLVKASRNEAGIAEMVRGEVARLLDVARKAEARAERLNKFLLDNLRTLGIDRIQAGQFKISVCRNSRPSIFASIWADVPAEFQKIEIKADNEKAYQHWKNTGEVPAGFSCDLGWHLRIR